MSVLLQKKATIPPKSVGVQTILHGLLPLSTKMSPLTGVVWLFEILVYQYLNWLSKKKKTKSSDNIQGTRFVDLFFIEIALLFVSKLILDNLRNDIPVFYVLIKLSHSNVYKGD